MRFLIVLLYFSFLVLSAAEQPVRVATAYRVMEKPKIDGFLTEQCWRKAFSREESLINKFTALSRKGVVSYQRKAAALYDNDNLYIAMEAFCPSSADLHKGTDIGRGDAVEVFIHADGKKYQIAMDFEGLLYSMPKIDFSGKTEFKEQAWSAEFSIPWKSLGIEMPSENMELGFNIAANRASQSRDAGIPITWGSDYQGRNSRLRLAGNIPALNEAVAEKVALPPELDGNLMKPCWQNAVPVRDFKVFSKGESAPVKERQVMFCHDDDNLYLAVEVTANDEDEAVFESRADQPHLGDCIRIDFASTATGVDCAGKDTRIMIPYLIPIKIGAKRSEMGWSAEIAIPKKFIGTPDADGKIKLNLFFTDSLEGLLTWSAVGTPRERDVDHFNQLKLKE